MEFASIEHNCSIYFVVSILMKLKNICQITSDNDEIIRELKNNLATNLHSYYKENKGNKAMTVTFLDPKYFEIF